MKKGIVQEHHVRIVRDQKTKNLIGEYWSLAAGGRHRVFGPAMAEFDADGNPLEEAYFLNGRVDRPEEEGPAIIRWSPETHQIIYEEYRYFGEKHRSGKKPAIIRYDPHSGEIVDQEFWEDDKRKRPPTKDRNLEP